MNWYNLALYKKAALEDMLNQLGVSSDIQQFIMSLPNNQKGFYINALKQNPQLTLQELQGNVQPKEKIDPYLPHEYKMAERFPKKAQNWILVNLKNARNSNLDTNLEELTSLSNPNRNSDYIRIWNKLDYWLRTNGLTDLLTFNPNIQIDNKTVDDVEELIQEWHAVQSGEGEGLMYEPTKEELIVYGPQWENPEWNGWTIQEVIGKNDLSVEGNKQNHCVGSYCQQVEDGAVRIFSLRNPANEPVVTIETSPDMKEFKQLMGNSNSEPKAVHKSMIKEWITKSGIEAFYDGYDSQEPDSMEEWRNYFNELETGGTTDEYGLKKDPDLGYGWDEFLPLIIRDNERQSGWYSRHNGRYYRGDIVELPSDMVDAALKSGHKALYDLLTSAEEIRQEKEEEIMGNYYWEPHTSPPDEEDYETEEEYEEALEKHREEMEELEAEEYKEYTSEITEIGLTNDIWKHYNELVDAGKAPDWRTLKESVENKQNEQTNRTAAQNWYIKTTQGVMA